MTNNYIINIKEACYDSSKNIYLLENSNLCINLDSLKGLIRDNTLKSPDCIFQIKTSSVQNIVCEFKNQSMRNLSVKEIKQKFSDYANFVTTDAIQAFLISNLHDFLNNETLNILVMPNPDIGVNFIDLINQTISPLDPNCLNITKTKNLLKDGITLILATDFENTYIKNHFLPNGKNISEL